MLNEEVHKSFQFRKTEGKNKAQKVKGGKEDKNR
jgi:hypothetical protein